MNREEGGQPANRPAVAGAILAGGRGTRMGTRDKALADLGGRPLLDHVAARLARQANPLVLNANGDPVRFARFGLPVVADLGEGFAGPLAGLLAVLGWARRATAASRVVTVPVDTPFLPLDLVDRLLAGLGDAEIAVARSRGTIHPVVGLWPVAIAADLAAWLGENGERSVRAWLATRTVAPVDFDVPGAPDPFFNVNTPSDLAAAADRLKAGA